MTLKELAEEYRKVAVRIDVRITELERSDDPAAQDRLKILRSMLRDCKEQAAFCSHYHDKGYHSNGKYKM